MLSTANRCPVCFIPKRKGRRCEYHVNQRARGLSDEFIRQSAEKTLERNQVIQLLCEAVDDARQRTEYHRRYYQANRNKRREQRLNSNRKRKVLNIHAHLIKQLCHAVDIGRATASW